MSPRNYVLPACTKLIRKFATDLVKFRKNVEHVIISINSDNKKYIIFIVTLVIQSANYVYHICMKATIRLVKVCCSNMIFSCKIK